MSGDGIDRFLDALRGRNDARYAGARRSATLIVTRVETDSAGGVLAAYGTLQGQDATEFAMPMRGRAASVGDHLLGTFPAADPLGGELQYERHVFSDNPAAGLLVPDADLPAPRFAADPFTTDLDASTTAIDASIVVYFLAVEARYLPSGYTISHRVAGTDDWVDQPVPHLGGQQVARLSRNFPPGEFVDVKLRARYNWAGAESLPSETKTTRAAVDDVSPGDATALVADAPAPGALHALTSAALNNHFHHFRYDVAIGPTGPVVRSVPEDAELDINVAGGDYYLAVTPISTTGVEGGRYPASGFIGPISVTASGAVVDTTPPDAWLSAPLVAMLQYQERPLLQITLPGGYTYSADYDRTEARVTNNGVYIGFVDIPLGQTVDRSMQVDYGTASVALVAIDKNGNRSLPSPAGTASLGNSGAPGVAPTVTTSPASEAVVVRFTYPLGATAVELRRATDAGGTGDTLVGLIDGTMYVDTFPGIAAGTAYYYRARGVNARGNGPYSPWTSGTVGAVNGANLAVNSVAANKLAAALVLADKLMTAAAPGTRVEVRGALGVDPNQLRMIENIAGAEYLRALLTGAALTFYNNAGGIRSQLYESGLSIYASNGDANGHIFIGDGGGDTAYLANYFMTLTKLQMLFQMLYAGARLYFRMTASPAQNAWIVERVSDGELAWTSNVAGDLLTVRNGKLGFAAAAGAADATIERSAAAQLDLKQILRVVNADGAAIKLAHTGASGNAHLDQSNGSFYYGWFTNPGGNHHFGAGGAAYGHVYGILHDVSGAALKREITNARTKAGALEAIRPKRFVFVGSSKRRLGFVAEEVEAALPEAVDTAPRPPREDGTPDDGDPVKAINPTALVAHLWGVVREQAEAIADLSARLARLEAARP